MWLYKTRWAVFYFYIHENEGKEEKKFNNNNIYFFNCYALNRHLEPKLQVEEATVDTVDGVATERSHIFTRDCAFCKRCPISCTPVISSWFYARQRLELTMSTSK